MDKLPMCRICLVEDVKMYSLIRTKLQELYENLTKTSFVTKDMKPVQVCYLCYARLQNCHRLQATCLKSEEFLNKVMTDIKLKYVELQDLNTLKTFHPLMSMSCMPKVRKDPDDDKIDEDNDVICNSIEIDVHAKDEFIEDIFTNMAIDNESEGTFEDEDINTEDGEDNSHSMQDPNLQHDILKRTKTIFERIDLETFKIGPKKKKNQTISLSNRSKSIKPEIKSTVIENKNIEEKIQTEIPVILKNKNILNQKISFIDKNHGIKYNDVQSNIKTYICEKSFPDKRELRRRICHDISERPYRCNMCMQSFTEKGHLRRHIRIHTGERPYKCEVCAKNFIQRSHLVSHTLKHTSERPYICNVCRQSFTEKGHLQKHSRIHTGEKPYKCEECGKSFTQRSNLVSHVRTHTKERPYICNICGRTFNEKSNLRRHILIHIGDKPYKCKVCQKSFSQKSHLTSHMRIHTGEKPHKCNICEKRFTRKAGLVKHTLKHTEKKPYVCDICDKSYNWRSDLITHIHMHMKIH